MTTHADPGWVAIPALAPAAAARVLRAPFLPPAAAEIVEHAPAAAVLRVPWCIGLHPAWRLRAARALHALAAPTGPLVRAVGATGAPPPGTVALVDLDAAMPPDATLLECWLDDATAWVLVGTTRPDALPASLRARCGVILDVPPLGARPDAIVAIAAAHAATIAARAGRPAPTLALAAVETLQRAVWPEDVPALEAAIARAVLLAPGPSIERTHLACPGAPAEVASPAQRTGPSTPGALAAPAVIGADQLELLLAEMGHELKNPLTVLKPYTQVPDVLADPVERAHFATLAGEAVDRMDALLDNVVAFGRLGVARPAPVDVGHLLDGLLDDAREELAARAVTVRRTGTPDARCAADPEQLTYALRNLLAGVLREVPAREELVVDTTANGIVRLRFVAAGSAARRFDELVTERGGGSGDPSVLRLPFSLARAALARSGAGLEVVAAPDGGRTVVVRLPPAPARDPGSDG